MKAIYDGSHESRWFPHDCDPEFLDNKFPAFLDKRADGVKGLEAVEGVEVYVAVRKADGKEVGWLSIAPGAPYFYNVFPEEQGKGYGNAIVKVGSARARELANAFDLYQTEADKENQPIILDTSSGDDLMRGSAFATPKPASDLYEGEGYKLDFRETQTLDGNPDTIYEQNVPREWYLQRVVNDPLFAEEHNITSVNDVTDALARTFYEEQRERSGLNRALATQARGETHHDRTATRAPDAGTWVDNAETDRELVGTAGRATGIG